MLTEVDYIDMNGSICWFCGQDLRINELCEQSGFDNVDIKTYRCLCEQGHTSFVQHYISKAKYNLQLTTHLFIYIDDYFEHMGININQIDPKIQDKVINIKEL